MSLRKGQIIEAGTTKRAKLYHAKVLEHALHDASDYCDLKLPSALRCYAPIFRCNDLGILMSLLGLSNNSNDMCWEAFVRPMEKSENAICCAFNMLSIGKPRANKYGVQSLHCLGILADLSAKSKKARLFSGAPHTFACKCLLI